MAESPFTEHKLVLQDFLTTPAGNRLASTMAEARGVSEAVVRGWAAAMPEMDFYVPFVQHRQTWTGDAALVVAANLDEDEPRFTGYTPQGAALQFDSRNGTPRHAVVFLHPSEPKGVRPPSAPRIGGARTIEDSRGPVAAVVYTSEECDRTARTCLGGGGGGGTSPATYTAYWASYINYHGDGVGGVEVKLQHFAGSTGTKISEKVVGEDSHLDWTGYYYDWRTTANQTMNFLVTGTTWIRVYEEDQYNDDYWGQGAFGGFNLRHRFYTYTNVEYIQENNPCRVDNYNYCGTNPTVDIYYAQ